MKTKYLLWPLIVLTKLNIIFLFSSCNKKIPPFEKQTIIFKEYLQSTFKIHLSKETLHFFVIPSSSCTGCISGLMSSINSKSISNSYIIVSLNQQIKLKDLNLNGRVLIDKENKIDNLNLMSLNTSLITWSENRIVKIEALTPENVGKVIDELK